MWNNKLCLGILGGESEDVYTQIKLFKDTGFDGFFINWNEDSDVCKTKEYADSIGMIFQSIHAPFSKIDAMWKNDERTEFVINRLKKCVDDCQRCGVAIMICHAFIGFNEHEPNDIGVENYRKLVEYAKERGVNIAFENTEGEEYLALLMKELSSYPNVRFCLDTGHEMCYNHSKDMLSLYGEKLIATHLNDNLGIRDYNGVTTSLDDLHLLPFDGACDWEDIVDRLNAHGYHGILTFELKRHSRGRKESDIYTEMSLERYVVEAYKRACKVAMLKMRRDRHR